MLIAALAAHGISEITNVQYIERGYEDVIGKIRGVGGRIRSVELPEEDPLARVRNVVIDAPPCFKNLRCLSYNCQHGSVEGRIGYLTDTGYITEEAGDRLLGADLLLLESNHDIELLRAGRYPYYLKQRILGPQGHLSNGDAAAYAAGSVRAGTRTVVLMCHAALPGQSWLVGRISASTSPNWILSP